MYYMEGKHARNDVCGVMQDTEWRITRYRQVVTGLRYSCFPIHTCTLTSCDVFSLNWCCYWRRVKKAACRWYQPSWWMDFAVLVVCIERVGYGMQESCS